MDQNRWSLTEEQHIVWNVAQDPRKPHQDHVEMSGKKVSLIVRYGVSEEGQLVLSRHVVWPGLRTKPNNTHASLMQEFDLEQMPLIQVNGTSIDAETVTRVAFDGLLHISTESSSGIGIERTIFPSTDKACAVEQVHITNRTAEPVTIQVSSRRAQSSVKGVAGIYLINITHDCAESVSLAAGASYTYGVYIGARHLRNELPAVTAAEERSLRSRLVEGIARSLRLETPDPILNSMFGFAKLRAGESIYETKGGLMHSPGGGRYYAAVWTNDQVEYAGPFFPYLGHPLANEATLNALRLYMPFMGPDFQPIPSSIIAEGIDIWEGAGDRGDAAMYAYGASLFALNYGDRAVAEELWPAIQWCLAYCERMKTDRGVIASDSDELENRFPSGSANLSTSCLAYGGYRHAANVARSLGKAEFAEQYDKQADLLEEAIEQFFGANVEGFDTYRYYEENDILRSWICLPLTMGMMNRKEETIRALLSPRLWTDNGLATQAGDTTFWDRSTLYGFRGIFAAGETATALQYLKSYSERRLLGDHVPYAIEAYPEGNQRHLSAESALYGLVIVEGLFGLKPVGLHRFVCAPKLPDGWDKMALRSVKAFGHEFDLVATRENGGLTLTVSEGNRSLTFAGAEGTAFEVSL
ncbi:hypothetical protein ACFQ88_09135 [Paenibacillus sp. NPDC056579]|uniref:hypothetical protein n=1 Tax=Paenibacillus sp. NPDC056579 TaxID=3345871 RepID=UPI0036D1058C